MLNKSNSFGRRDFLRALCAAAGAPAIAGAQQRRRPNILLILADDLGFSDLGCFGGEIETPNLDRLAENGIRMTQFYTTARCCPSRASLITGLYPHQTGLGHMTGVRREAELAGYQPNLSASSRTVAERLREAGYSTLMTGKWHLGQPTPDKRGFDEFYGMVHGFDSFWDSSKYQRLPEGRPARQYKDGEFYATDAITDHALDFLQAAGSAEKPWFLYLAYNAPHFPLHAPKDLIDKYDPVYRKGWDAIREQRYARQLRMKLIDSSWPLTPRSVIPPNRVATPHGWADQQNPAWRSVEPERQRDMARRMAIFAAMVDRMDWNIGRILRQLEQNSELDNTLILFLSDNGACAEWDPWGFDVRSGPENVLHRGEALAGMGQPGTYHSYGSAWANASNTPWRLYKHYSHEGGITTPFIAHWPAGEIRRKAIEHDPAHLIDLAPSLLEAAGVAAPPELEGRSLIPLFHGRRPAERALFFEHEGSRAVREGRWKLVAVGAGEPWELYDLQADRAELENLAGRFPDRVNQMARRWEKWAKRTHVLPWPWQPQYSVAE